MRSRTTIGAVTALSFSAAAAHGQTSAYLDIKLWNGASWVDEMTVGVGQARVRCGVFIGFGGGGYGVSGAVYNVVGTDINGTGSGITAEISGPGLGRIPPFNFGAATQGVFVSGNRFRIDGSTDVNDVPNLGIATAQNSPPNLGANFNSQNPALVYAFDFIANTQPGMDVRLEAPDLMLRGVIGIYSDAQATRGTNVQNVTVDGARIFETPGPGTWLGVMMGGVMVRRRGRK